VLSFGFTPPKRRAPRRVSICSRAGTYSPHFSWGWEGWKLLTKLDILRQERDIIRADLEHARNNDMKAWLETRMRFVTREIEHIEAKVTRQANNQISGPEL
jgi:hypothetical protein